ADLLVRIDVRISDAVSGDARAGRQSDRADEPSHRPPADVLWRRAWLTVGHLRSGLQCARFGIYLPVLEFRGARAGAETWPQRERRRGTLRDGPRDDGRTGCFSAQLRSAGGGRRERPLRLLRGVGLYKFASARGQRLCGRSLLHGTPPGLDRGRY